jgi:hypothetical protein
MWIHEDGKSYGEHLESVPSSPLAPMVNNISCILVYSPSMIILSIDAVQTMHMKQHCYVRYETTN